MQGLQLTWLTDGFPSMCDADMGVFAFRIPEVEKLQPDEKDESLNNKYNIEFMFDCDVKCTVKIMLFCTEEISNGQIRYICSSIYQFNK